MRKLRTIAPVVAAFTLFASVTITGNATAEEARYATFLPPKNPAVEYGAVPFMERVEKDSNGEMSYKLFAGASLLGGKNMLHGLRDGVADIGQIIFGYFPSELPYAALVADMAIYGSFPPAVTAAVTEFNFLHCQGCLDGYKENGIVVLGSVSTSPYQLLGKEDLSTVESLKGKKIRTAGALWSRWASYVGAVPVSIAGDGMYEALSRGQVDVIMQPVGALRSYSFWDIARKATLLNLGTYRSWGIYSISLKYWNSLTVPQREILMRNAAIGLIQTSKGYMKADEEVTALADEKKLEFFEPSDELKKSVEEFLKADRATVVETAKTKYQIADPEPLMDKLVELIGKWEKQFEPIKNDDAAMADMLWDQVLSKVDVRTLGQ
tara:strand:- start:24518 stop:25657 length:1140 start_codon:yes stop_codon:yes gene_type:complete